MAQSITLTASMRSNLQSLKSIQKQMDTTQERLSTGKKVNSAIDNASSYYQARSLTNRASDLDGLLDSMGQGIQTIQAANEGIEAVTSFVEQLKSIATSAFALDPTNTETYQSSIESYQKQYDEIIKEIGKLVKDSSYQGVNLLTGGELTVTFNETRSNRFTIEGDDIMERMDLTNAADWTLDYPQVNKVSGAEVTVNTEVNINAGTATVSYTDATPTTTTAVKYEGNWYDSTSGNAITDEDIIAGLNASSTAGTSIGTGGLDITVANKVAAGAQLYNVQTTEDATNTTEAIMFNGKYYTTAGVEVTPYAGTTPEAVTEADTTGTQSYATSIDKTLDELSVAIDYLRSYATELGNNYSIIETRQNFTDALIDVLETGADNLVLADMNEESANYLALQTRQQLAVNSLSLASQSAQSVLSLF